KVQFAFIPLALAVVACSPPAPETAQQDPAASPVPEDIAALALAAVPRINITSGELADDEYDGTGTLPNGDEVEIDLVRSNGGWTVLEIQRDVAWSSVPEPVRAAAAAAPDSFEPVRVIESAQAEDGSVVYELFRTTGGGGPAME